MVSPLLLALAGCTKQVELDGSDTDSEYSDFPTYPVLVEAVARDAVEIIGGDAVQQNSGEKLIINDQGVEITLTRGVFRLDTMMIPTTEGNSNDDFWMDLSGLDINTQRADFQSEQREFETREFPPRADFIHIHFESDNSECAAEVSGRYNSDQTSGHFDICLSESIDIQTDVLELDYRDELETFALETHGIHSDFQGSPVTLSLQLNRGGTHDGYRHSNEPHELAQSGLFSGLDIFDFQDESHLKQKLSENLIDSIGVYAIHE